MTRKEFRDLLRSLSSELDNKAVLNGEINEWIEQDYKLFFDRKAYEQEKRKHSVNVPFVIKH